MTMFGGYEYKPRFGMKPPRGVEDDDDPYGEEERGLLDDLSTLPSDDVANRLRIRARLSALRAARMDRKQSAEDRKRAREPVFKFEDRPVEGGPGVGASIGRYRIKTDPDTGAVLDESFVDYFPDMQGRKAERAEAQRARERNERFEFEKAQAEETRHRSDYRFAAGEAQAAKTERVRAAEREQDRKDTLARQARADEAERYRLREYYDRLAQGANFESAQRRQMEGNRQEQAGFQQQANLQREDAAIKYASQLERLLAEPARFWSSIGSNPAQIEKVINQLVQYNFGGRFDRLIAMLRAGPEQQRQPALAAPRFAERA